MLVGLARRRVLEVSFGGGEPLAFRGFDDLLTRLRAETDLALHFTTNGVLLDDARIARIAPLVGEVRVSVYDDTPWDDRIARLASAGVRVGANVLVTPGREDALPPLLDRLHDLGASDVALLSYVGPDDALHLDAASDARIAAAIAESPIGARLSVCFGDRLDPLPRLDIGTRGDCGAGLDFVVIGSDRRMKSCSFVDGGFVVDTADDVITAWRARRDLLLAPSPRSGCARALGTRASQLSDGVRVYRSFSGNNSGDCVLVGRFERAVDARRVIDDLLPGFRPGERYPEAWNLLLRAEKIDPGANEVSPDAIAALGRCVLLHTDSTLDDDFPALRELVWRRGGQAFYNGIHEHDAIYLVAGMRARDSQAAESAAIELGTDDVSVERHGRDLYATMRIYGASGMPTMIDARASHLTNVASRHGAAVAGELVAVDEDAHLARALPALAREEHDAWMWARFRSPEDASRAAARLAPDEGIATIAGRALLVGTRRVRSRLGAILQHAGAAVTIVNGAKVKVSLFFTGPRDAPPLDVESIRAWMRPYVTGDLEVSSIWASVSATTITAEPARVLEGAAQIAKSRDLALWPSIASIDPLASALRRIRKDLITLGARR
jgi:hypothetical protein